MVVSSSQGARYYNNRLLATFMGARSKSMTRVFAGVYAGKSPVPHSDEAFCGILNCKSPPGVDVCTALEDSIDTATGRG